MYSSFSPTREEMVRLSLLTELRSDSGDRDGIRNPDRPVTTPARYHCALHANTRIRWQYLPLHKLPLHEVANMVVCAKRPNLYVNVSLNTLRVWSRRWHVFGVIGIDSALLKRTYLALLFSYFDTVPSLTTYCSIFSRGHGWPNRQKSQLKILQIFSVLTKI